ncbi:MAG: CrcB family protein [Bowdeniella nasicola]|nr:CrcB family protein [Bowdeniella nasicola]
MTTPLTALALALAAALGGVCRVSLDIAVRRGREGVAGIIVVNVLGSFLLGLLAAALGVLTLIDGTLRVGASPTPTLYTVVGLGFLGAFTTFSTAMVDVAALGRRGRYGRATALALGTLALSVAACALGVLLGS